MPSKGGRRQAGAQSASAIAGYVQSVAAAMDESRVVAASPPSVGAFQITDADLARALRRGFEVERFNQLARRDQELTPEESDELYRLRLRRLQSRLRRLDRIRVSDDEEAIRATLDDFEARLQELRSQEETRRAAGLAIAEQVDLSVRQSAIDRLLELSRRRPAGLIAGSDTIPVQPHGNTRLREIAFRSSPDDIPIYILAPASILSDALVRNIEGVAGQGAQLRLVHEPSEIPRDGDRPPLVINWGGNQALPADLITLNRAEAVQVSSDQVESLRRLGELAPRTVLRPDDTGLLGTEQVVAKQRHGARGSGKAVIRADAGWSERVRYDLFQELVPRRREWRISLLNNHVVSAYLKRAPEGTPAEDLRPGWIFERADVLPRAVVSAAREGARRIGLDYSGVDVIEDPSGRMYCIEANAAPGMSEHTLRRLYAHLQQTVRGRLEQAG
jgi:hypothetical protein